MPIDFKQHTLSNGLTVLAEVNESAHTAGVGFFVKTGARDETPELMGVSHFLEHMMFKGTDRRSADDVNREFDEIGANYNAYTSHEQTVYYAHVLPEVLPQAVDLFSDMLRPALRNEDFDTEKQVILEEIGMYDDRPEWRLQDRLLEEHYGKHSLGYRVLGTTQTVGALTADQMRNYFNHRYSPDNMVVSAAGRVDFDRLCADLEARCGRWTPTHAQRTYTAPREDERRVEMKQASVNRHYLAMLCPGPPSQDVMRYPAKVLSDVLGDSDGSRLYWALIDPGLADEADFSFWPHDQAGAFMAFTSCEPDRAQAIEAKLFETLDAVVTGAPEVSSDEVHRAVNKLVTRATLQGERPSGRMQALGSKWLVHGRYVSLDEELDHLLAVTADDVRTVLNRYTLMPRTVVTLGPES